MCMIRRTPHVNPLQRLSLFEASDETELRIVNRLLTEVRVDAGRALIREGAVGSECFIIGDGRVLVTRHSTEDSDRDEIVAVVGPGEVLGEMSLLHRTPRSATVTTLEPTTIYVANRREFFSLLEAAPSVAQKIADAAAIRLTANAAA
jgi:CRP-like cAMP-binding protein